LTIPDWKRVIFVSFVAEGLGDEFMARNF
jgi:hypothetical protein